MRRRLVRGVAVVAAAVLLIVVVRSAAAGVLFPWSPVKPGFETHRFASGRVHVPHGTAYAPDYRAMDSIASRLEALHGLRFRKKVHVVVSRDWRQFNRGTFIARDGSPRPVLGAALQTGDVVYMSPLAAEPGRRPGGILAHELAHALLYQHVSLRGSVALRRERWLLEGLAVHFGNPGDYPGPETFRGLVRTHPEYVFHPAADPRLDRLPADVGGLFMLAEYRFFIEYLIERFGEDRLRALVRAAVAEPADVPAAFAATYGASLDTVGAEFVRAVRAGQVPALADGAPDDRSTGDAPR